MAIIMNMYWPEVSEAQYQEARKLVNWEGDNPPGGKFHTAWMAADGFHVLDLWESAEQFEAFVQTRLMPAVQQIGIERQPRVQMETPLSIFAPNPA
jgi:hypothetical protein